MKKHKVYVYGTLRPGGAETVLVPGRLYNLGWYPGIELKAPTCGSFVTCEIIEVTDEELANLDQYEGYVEDYPEGSLYLRTPYLGGFIYTYNADMSSRELVESGDWLLFRDQKSGSAATTFVKPVLEDNEMGA